MMADMTAPTTTTAPITGFSHIQLLVSDVATSERWYTAALGLDVLTRSATGDYVALIHRPARVVIVLTPHPGRPSADGVLDPGVLDHGVLDHGVLDHGVLDHIAFAVPDGPTLQSWADQLTAAGIDHPGIVLELGKPSLQLRDPDGIAVELVAPPPRT
jgi:glyoxylase I family protein